MVDYFVFIVSFVIGISLLVLCLCSVKCVGLCTRIEPYVYHPSSPVANAKIEMSEEELEERRQYILKRIGHQKVLIPNHDHSTTTSSSSTTTGSSGGTTCDDGEDHHDHDLVDEEEGTSFHENNLEEIDLELGMPSTTSTCTATRTGDLASSSSSPSSSPSSSAQPYQCGAHPTTDSTTAVTTTSTTPSKPTTTNVEANAIATAPTSASVCPICMEEYEVGDNIAWSYNKQCPHVYHVDCIVQWLMKDQNGSSKNGDDCPMCRSSYLVDDPPSNIITKRLSYLVARS